MRMLGFAACVVCPAVWLGTATAAPVKVESGPVEGVVEGTLTVYKGLPFATPPVGDLRWRAPQPAQKWSGVRKADQYAPGCMQSMGGPPPSGMSASTPRPMTTTSQATYRAGWRTLLVAGKVADTTICR